MRDLWPILNYEIQMYLGARHLQGLPVSRSDPNLLFIPQSAMTEVEALHIRILTEIFLEKSEPDNLNIDDLVPAWRKDNAILVHDLYDAYTKHLDTGHHPKYYLNRFLAHPDKRRGDHFDWSAIINRMDPPLQSIFKALPMDENCLPALVYFKKYIE